MTLEEVKEIIEEWHYELWDFAKGDSESQAFYDDDLAKIHAYLNGEVKT